MSLTWLKIPSQETPRLTLDYSGDAGATVFAGRDFGLPLITNCRALGDELAPERLSSGPRWTLPESASCEFSESLSFLDTDTMWVLAPSIALQPKTNATGRLCVEMSVIDSYSSGLGADASNLLRRKECREPSEWSAESRFEQLTLERQYVSFEVPDLRRRADARVLLAGLFLGLGAESLLLLIRQGLSRAAKIVG